MADALPLERRPTDVRAVLERLSVLDRFLPLWIFLAMAIGIALGASVPGLPALLDAVKLDTVSLPIAIGLLWMVYPAFARVRYEQLARVGRAWRLFGLSLVLNWLVGPLLMFALVWVLLPDHPEYRTGLVLVGLARCIGMVLVWNQLAGGDTEAAAILVALNSVFQVVAYSFFAYVFLTMLPTWLGLDPGQAVTVEFWGIAKNVLVFLGIPLAAGVATRYLGIRVKGRDWYESVAMPKLAPTALIALLFTIVVIFSLKGDLILALPGDVVRIALPLLAYFGIVFGASFWWAWRAGFSYAETTTLALTAAGNNFELALAVAIATFGIASGQALAAVVGPLIEVPALVGLVYISLWLGRRLSFGRASR